MRISDWSSDVCSSDLLSLGQGREPVRAHVTQHMEFTISGSVDDERIFDNFATKWLVADLVTPRNRVPSIAQVFHAYTLSGASSIVDPSSCNNLPVARALSSEPSRIAGPFYRISRSEERRVGKAWVSTCGSRGWPAN